MHPPKSPTIWTSSPRHGWSHVLPPASHPLRHWLQDAGSLTARLRARCTHFEVRVLMQRRARLLPDEAAVLGLSIGSSAMVREVVLHADGVPVVFARSAFAADCRAWRPLAVLGNRPLGAALFADPAIARGRLSVLRLDARDRRYRRALAQSGHGDVAELWARRSCFTRRGRALLVCEVFLPGMRGLPR